MRHWESHISSPTLVQTFERKRTFNIITQEVLRLGDFCEVLSNADRKLFSSSLEPKWCIKLFLKYDMVNNSKKFSSQMRKV